MSHGVGHHRTPVPARSRKCEVMRFGIGPSQGGQRERQWEQPDMRITTRRRTSTTPRAVLMIGPARARNPRWTVGTVARKWSKAGWRCGTRSSGRRFDGSQHSPGGDVYGCRKMRPWCWLPVSEGRTPALRTGVPTARRWLFHRIRPTTTRPTEATVWARAWPTARGRRRHPTGRGQTALSAWEPHNRLGGRRLTCGAPRPPSRCGLLSPAPARACGPCVARSHAPAS
jgi:hypothetical protein